MVCLGAGISSDAPEPITTTLNQCWSRGELLINKSQKAYWQDSVGYYLQSGNRAVYSNQEQKGSWNHIDNSQSPDLVKGRVFKLWIDHGRQPQNASYSYIVIPGISNKQFYQEHPYKDLKIISNTDTIQAVFSSRLKMLQIVFYQSGTLRTGKETIGVNKPCVLMLEKTNTSHPAIYIADPTHQLQNILITLNGKKINCKLPTNEYAGSTTKVYVE